MKNQSDCPNSFVEHTFEKTFPFGSGEIQRVWNNLNKRETFCKGQPFPYKVEFESGLDHGEFKTGELNIHHGPLLSVHGEIWEISNNYRDLRYFYGSYVLSFRLVRPVRLEFFREGVVLRVRLTSYVKPWFKTLWDRGNSFFWNFFDRTVL
ncbi:MAG: hypothetical protein NXH75_08785 [Halobacteriovoraceae bacterium]|nr:hypothetical protein [Halobacteriovoraceae bacterium]